MRTRFSFFIILVVLASVSCERQGNPFEKSVASDGFKAMCQDLSNYIKDHSETIDFDSLTEYAKGYGDFESAEVRDSVLYLHFRDDFTYFFDMYGKNAPDTSGMSQLDTSLVIHILDSLSMVTFADSLFYDQEKTSPDYSYLSTRASGSPSVFRKTTKTVFFWNAFVDPTLIKELTRVINQCHLIPRSGSSLNDLSNICNYDIAIIAAHGGYGLNTGNNIPTLGFCLPITYEGELAKRNIYPKICGTTWVVIGGDNVDHFVLSRTDLDKILPNLSNTIVWAAICYAGNVFSDVKNAFVTDKKALEFYGTEDKNNYYRVSTAFSRWAPAFFNRCIDSKSAFENGNTDKTFKRYGDRTVFYVEGCALPPIKENNNYLITGFRKLSSRVVDFIRGETRSGEAAIDGSGEGLHLVNEDTHEEKYIPFNSQTVKHYKEYDHVDVTRFNIAVNPGELLPGTEYKYASYSTDGFGNKVIEGQYVTFRTQESWENTKWLFTGTTSYYINGSFYKSVTDAAVLVDVIDTKTGAFDINEGSGLGIPLTMSLLDSGQLEFIGASSEESGYVEIQMVLTRTGKTTAIGRFSSKMIDYEDDMTMTSSATLEGSLISP